MVRREESVPELGLVVGEKVTRGGEEGEGAAETVAERDAISQTEIPVREEGRRASALVVKARRERARERLRPHRLGSARVIA